MNARKLITKAMEHLAASWDVSGLEFRVESETVKVIGGWQGIARLIVCKGNDPCLPLVTSTHYQKDVGLNLPENNPEYKALDSLVLELIASGGALSLTMAKQAIEKGLYDTQGIDYSGYFKNQDNAKTNNTGESD